MTHLTFIDSHAHLDAPYFANRLPDVIQRARQAGVEKIVTIGVTPSSTRNCIQIANEFPWVFAAAGYHPHWARGATPERLSEAENLARVPSIVGLGEIGLDYHHFRSPKPEQINLFGLCSISLRPSKYHPSSLRKRVKASRACESFPRAW